MQRANFRLVSPLRVDCLLQPGVEFRNGADVHSFWEAVADQVGASHLRQAPGREKLEYETARSIDLPNDIAVLRKDLAVERDFSCGVVADSEVEWVRWSLCDFGILLVEMGLSLGVEGRSAATVEKQVQQVATDINERLITPSYLKLRDVIQSHDNASDFTVLEDSQPVELAWASRALIFDPAEGVSLQSQAEFAKEWLGGGSRAAEIVQQLQDGEITHHAEWMNYVYLLERSDNSVELQEQWKALLRAQFYYSAMGRIDSKLMRILAWAMANSDDISTKKLREQLRQAMDFAEALFLKKSEVGKYVNPTSREETERILRVWNFDEVLANPVKDKLQICQSRLDAIESERARSASFFTDLILMVIGVTSILGTALAVVSLGRSASADPDQTVYDLGAGDLTTWIATQPIDVILLISTIISVLMVIAFIMARKKSDS